MELKITNGTVKIDKGDFELISKYKWHINDQGYAIWRGIKDGAKRTIRMHRLIMNTPKGMQTDHINHDRADNRRANLRICTASENLRNKTDQGKGYWINKGKTDKPYVVEVNGIHRGCFATEEEAIEFVDLVRTGKVYKKEKIVKTHCKYGHNLEDAYIIQGDRRCKTCQRNRSKEYYKRKRELA